MTFFFDNNISPRLIAILKNLSVDALHLRDEFAPDTKDTEWIPKVGQEGWILVTADKNIRKNPAERDALKANQVTTLFLKDTFLRKGIWDQADWLIGHWRTIEKEATRLHQGTCVAVQENGKLEILR